MRIHHINCLSCCPLGSRWTQGAFGDGRSICHCLLLELERELVLVDTGLGLRDLALESGRWPPLGRYLLRPDLRVDLTAARQVARLGFDVADVRHILLTQLDFDHAGGLDDFPDARIHLLAAERDAAFRRSSLLERLRYRPTQWASSGRWCVYPLSEGEPWLGFDCVRELRGVGSEVLFVPLQGHSLGHAGVAVRRQSGWILDAGDAYGLRAELESSDLPRSLRQRAFEHVLQRDAPAYRKNLARLRALRASHTEVTVFSSHDPEEFEGLAGRPAHRPASAPLRLIRGHGGGASRSA